MKAKTETVAKEVDEYPMLMESEDKMLVYFTSYSHGMVLLEGEGAEIEGHWSNDWAMSCFKKFIGELVLEND